MTNNLEEAKVIYEKIAKSNKANVLDYYKYANLLPKGSKLAKEYRINNKVTVNNHKQH